MISALGTKFPFALQSLSSQSMIHALRAESPLGWRRCRNVCVIHVVDKTISGEVYMAV